jgi:hypothetical protein
VTLTILALVVGSVAVAAVGPERWAGAASSAGSGFHPKPCGCHVRCGRVKVPLGYDHPNDAQTELSVAIVPSLNGDAKGVLFVDPSGPGASAVDAVTAFSRFPFDFQDSFDLVGVDRRGVRGAGRLGCAPFRGGSDIPSVAHSSSDLQENEHRGTAARG